MALADINTDTAMAEPKEEGDTEQETAVGSNSKPKSLWTRFQDAMHQHGGAQQYLLSKYPDQEARKRFASDLRDYFPRREEVDYYLFKTCPPNEQPVVVHISDLGFGEAATTKPPLYKSVCLLVGEDIIKHTFQTEGAVGAGGRGRGPRLRGRNRGSWPSLAARTRVAAIAAHVVAAMAAHCHVVAAIAATSWPPLWLNAWPP